MNLSFDLLEQAQHLARREKKRPRQASLRRSVSCSYYALFHLLTGDAVAIVGPNLEQNTVHKIQRWFDHRDMKRVCGMFSVPTASPPIAVILDCAVPSDLQAVALAFIQLQEARHKADYDLESTWTRITAQQYAEIAGNAFDSWSRIRKTHEANVFALALLSAKLFDRGR